MIMKKCLNGKMVKLTPEEIAAMEAEQEAAEREYWQFVSYEEAVNTKIRERYSQSNEYAILRQMLTKPEEFQAYFDYCEECKAFVKMKKGIA